VCDTSTQTRRAQHSACIRALFSRRHVHALWARALAGMYSLTALYKLAMIAGVRTLLAYFLGKETEELEHELERATGKEITA
jgi:lipase chaperone LimK